MLKGNKGITLVALVITIIVLLILAGVSLAMISGENGILTNADKAKVANMKSEANSAIQMAINEFMTAYYGGDSDIVTAAQSEANTLSKLVDLYSHYSGYTATAGTGKITVDAGNGNTHDFTVTVTPAASTGNSGPKISLENLWS